MCDTLYAAAVQRAVAPLDGGARPRASWFAKNSDRSPDEPQTLCLIPATLQGPPLVIGGRGFPAGAGRHACALSRPTWMEGGEMGLNDAGLAIGNEAVFPRRSPAKDGILGMDLLRAALVACASADEAADYLCSFVEGHDQGGNGAYHGKLYYDNSYLVADRKGAWIVETAGIAGRGNASRASHPSRTATRSKATGTPSTPSPRPPSKGPAEGTAPGDPSSRTPSTSPSRGATGGDGLPAKPWSAGSPAARQDRRPRRRPGRPPDRRRLPASPSCSRP